MEERVALTEIKLMDRKVRVRSAWYGVFCLVLAVGAAAYVIVSHLLGAGHPAVMVLIVGTLIILGAIYWVHGRHQRVVSRVQASLDVPMGLGTIGLMLVALALRQMFVPDGFSVWLVLVALVPAIPCLIGAWKVLRP